MMVDLYLVNSINGRIMSYFYHHIMSRLEINQCLRLFRPLSRTIMYHSRTNLTFITSVSWLASFATQAATEFRFQLTARCPRVEATRWVKYSRRPLMMSQDLL